MHRQAKSVATLPHRSPPLSWRRGWRRRRPTASSWPIGRRHLRPPAWSPSPGRAARAAAGRPRRRGLHSTLRSLNSSPLELPAWRWRENSFVLLFVWLKRRREKTHQLKVSRWSSIRSCFSESVENSMFPPLNWTVVPENVATCSTRYLTEVGHNGDQWQRPKPRDSCWCHFGLFTQMHINFTGKLDRQQKCWNVRMRQNIKEFNLKRKMIFPGTFVTFCQLNLKLSDELWWNK